MTPDNNNDDNITVSVNNNSNETDNTNSNNNSTNDRKRNPTTTTTNNPPAPNWILTPYTGLEITHTNGDGKTYTLILKDTSPPPDKRAEDDGRRSNKASVNWEADFVAQPQGLNADGSGDGETKVWVPWREFKPTFRGRLIESRTHSGEGSGEGGGKGAGGLKLKLKTEQVRSVGVMMRSLFGKQEGPFGVVLASVCARVVVPGTEAGVGGEGGKDNEGSKV